MKVISDSPNSSWKAGDSITPPKGNIISLDPKTVDTLAMYKILIGAIVPRPIAFVSSTNSKNRDNLAPFSFYNGVSSNPPCIMFSVARNSNGSKKDTLLNIEETGEFVVNTVNEWITEPMHQTSGSYEFEESEFEKTGLTPIASDIVKAPRVKEAAFQMECKTYKLVPVGGDSPGSSVVVIGEIVKFHAYDTILVEGKVLIEKLKPISRLAGRWYGKIGDMFEMERPKV